MLKTAYEIGIKLAYNEEYPSYYGLTPEQLYAVQRLTGVGSEDENLDSILSQYFGRLASQGLGTNKEDSAVLREGLSALMREGAAPQYNTSRVRMPRGKTLRASPPAELDQSALGVLPTAQEYPGIPYDYEIPYDQYPYSDYNPDEYNNYDSNDFEGNYGG